MTNSFSGNDSPKPAMEQIEGVKRDVEHPNQRVVSASHDDKGNHVSNGKGAGAISKLLQHCRFRAMPLDCDDAKGYVHSNDAGEEDTLNTSW